jgi:hypothetical protein
VGYAYVATIKRFYRNRAAATNTIYTALLLALIFTPLRRLRPHRRLRHKPPHGERHKHNAKQDQPYPQRQILIVPQLDRRRVDVLLYDQNHRRRFEPKTL